MRKMKIKSVLISWIILAVFFTGVAAMMNSGHEALKEKSKIARSK